MKTLLLDTNTLIYVLKGQDRVLDRLEEAARSGNRFLLASVVHFELTRYLKLKGAHRLIRDYEQLVSSWSRCDLTFEDWDAAAILWAQRSRSGRSASDLDLLLAILARREEAVLVTSNTRHFEGFGLSLENWDAPVLEMKSDHAPGLERAFAAVPEERSGTRLRIEGEVPAFLRGTYYLNGPARFARGEVRYLHWLDGDGMVCALCFGEEGAHLTARFARGTKLVEEEAAGRALYRAFGTAFPDDRLVKGIALESPLNVSIVPFNDTLLVFGEQGLPYELDPHTLETRGLYTFGGALNPLSPFAAHPKIDPGSGEMFNFGISFSATQPSLNLYRFGAGGKLIYRRRLPLPEPRSLHDFCLAGRHVIFYLGPYWLDMESLRQGNTLLDSLRWEPEKGSRLLIARREDGEAVASVPVGERYVLHGINAFEDPSDSNRLIVDVLELDRPVYDQYNVPDLFPDVAPGRPVRLTIDLAAGALVDRLEIAYDRAPDFPAIDPDRAGRPYEDFWMLGISHTGRPGRKTFDQVVHASWAHPDLVEVWTAPAGHYLGGEPAFAPDPADPANRGAVICQRFDAATGESAFLVFDAFDVARGPVAVLPLDRALHLGFHALFQPA